VWVGAEEVLEGAAVLMAATIPFPIS
jgi:hypothetical protein